MRFGIFPRKGSGWRPSSALGTHYLEAQRHSESSKTSIKRHVSAEARLDLHRGARCNNAKQIHTVSNTENYSFFRTRGFSCRDFPTALLTALARLRNPARNYICLENS